MKNGKRLTLEEWAFVKKAYLSANLEREEEFFCIKKWVETQDNRALQRIVDAYSKLIVAIAFRYDTDAIAFQDLLQEGFLGLMTALSRFDLKTNNRFGTYARFWIHAFVQNYVLLNWSIVRFKNNTHIRKIFFNFSKLKERIHQIQTELNEDKSPKSYEVALKDVAEQLNVTMKLVKHINERLQSKDCYIDQHISATNQKTIIDLNLTPEDTSIEHEIDVLRHKKLFYTLGLLSEEERVVICKRFLRTPPIPFDRIAKGLNKTCDNVRTLHRKALVKMKKELAKDKESLAF